MPLQLSASLNLTGSLNLSGSMTATQILNITASLASSASNAISSQTASFVPVATYNITASWANNSRTASGLISSSTYAVNSLTSSRVVITNTPSADTDAITRGYIVSRGQNLVTNGFGMLSNNYNLPDMAFDPVDFYLGKGSFTSSNFQSLITSSELIAVDVNKTYRGIAYAKSGDIGGTRYTASNMIYIGLASYDIDSNNITPENVAKQSGATDSTLYAQLNIGDTSMLVTDTTGWQNSTNYLNRRIAWWPYTSSLGYVYDTYTYTRNITSTVVSSGSFYANNGLWASGSITQSVGSSSITLTAPWPGPVLSAGTPVRNAAPGSTYQYAFAISKFIPSGSWTKCTGLIGGLSPTGSDSVTVFRQGTAFVKFLILTNYSSGTAYSNNTNVHRISAISLNEESDSSGSAYVQGGNTVSSAASIGTLTTFPLNVITNNTTRITVSAGGNVGIGSANPAQRLEVVGNISASGNVTASVFAGSHTGSTFGTSSWSNNSVTASNLIATNNYTIVNLTASNISASNGIIIGSNFIAASITSSVLNVNSSGSTSASTNGSLTITGQNTKGGSNYHDFLYTRNTVAGGVNSNKYFRQDNTGNFEIVNSAYNNTIFTLTDSGSLQLPSAQSADVTQLRNTGAGLKVGNYGLLFDDGNVHLHSTSPNSNLWLNCSGSGIFIINGQSGATGGVGIGTSIMSGYVTINGGSSVTIGAYGYLINTGSPPTGTGASTTGTFSITCTQRVQATEFDATSDERLKNIEGEIPLNEAIDLVNKVKPIKYKWKDGVDTGTKTGYSAQQVYKAGFDHLIGVVKKDGMKETVDADGFVNPKDAQFVMNYEQVTPYHSKLIKHLIDKIETMESEIQFLKARLNK